MAGQCRTSHLRHTITTTELKSCTHSVRDPKHTGAHVGATLGVPIKGLLVVARHPAAAVTGALLFLQTKLLTFFVSSAS